MANGLCVYNGSPTQLVPFLSAAGYSCPPNYTPADYVIELIHSESSIVNTLKEAIENGKLNVKEISDEENSLETFHGEESCSDENKVTIQKSDLDFSSPFHVQFFLLLSRMMLQMKRNRIILYIQFFYHLLSGLVIAGIFTKIGNDATQIMVLLKYCICCVVFFSYTYTMIPILLCKLYQISML
ncbi:Coagulase domain containing protein [Asbolus verrucosus]|uniref:Coagulase domain containing protein n=1 Tax=Asbolus verrucosus TaxID=1661398 RepID=A0A482VUQ1_ASBVE|nr:Coagulase domain containing protein [Asbolus verrucosus]